MEYILILILLLNTSMFYSTIFDKKMGQTLFLSVFSYIIILFIFGVFGFLNAGFITILLLNILLFGCNINSFLKKKIDIKKNVLTIGLLLFLLSYIIIIWQSLGKLASSWDEFSHWALVVKNMYGLGNLGLGSDSTVMIKDYLSGTSLFQFFCVKLCGEFKESMLYVGMDLILISFIIPIIEVLKKKNNVLKCVLYFILFFIPVMFYPSLYSSLYVDGILGLCFGYTLYSYFNNREKNLTKFDVINLMMSFAMLIFIKDFGIVLLLISFAIILIDNMFIKNKFKFKIKEIWNNNLIILSVLPALLIKFIWMVTLSVYNVGGGSSSSSIIDTILNIFTFNLVKYQKEVVLSFAEATTSYSLTSDTFISVTYIVSMFIVFLIGYFIIKNSKKENKNTMSLMITLLLLGFIAYAGLILLAYLSVFSSYEALRLASFTRYMGSYALGAIFAVLAILSKNLSYNEKKFGVFIMILLSIFIIEFNFITVLKFIGGPIINNSQNVREPYVEFLEKTSKYVGENDCLYFISTNDNGIDYYIARYELTPNKMNPNTGWSIGYSYSDEDIWTVYKSPDDWRNELIEGYSYVYLYDIDEEFIGLYEDLFIDSNIEDNQLYKVNKTVGYPILEFVK